MTVFTEVFYTIVILLGFIDIGIIAAIALFYLKDLAVSLYSRFRNRP